MVNAMNPYEYFSPSDAPTLAALEAAKRLHKAVHQMDLQAVKAALSAGVVNADVPSGWSHPVTPLMAVCRVAANLPASYWPQIRDSVRAIIVALLDAGAKQDSQEELLKAASAFRAAPELGELVSELLAQAAGKAAVKRLHDAARRGSADDVKATLSAGVHPDAPSNERNHQTALKLVCCDAANMPASYWPQIRDSVRAIIVALLDAGAKQDSREELLKAASAPRCAPELGELVSELLVGADASR